MTRTPDSRAGERRHKSTDFSATSARPSCSSSMRRSGCIEGTRTALVRWADLGLPLDSLPWLGLEKIRTRVVDRSHGHLLRSAGHTADSRIFAPRSITAKTTFGLVSRVTPVQTGLRNCTRDEGGPFEFGNQVLISSHRKLLWSQAMVVSVAEKSGHDPVRQG
jgi:hypothetical protein